MNISKCTCGSSNYICPVHGILPAQGRGTASGKNKSHVIDSSKAFTVETEEEIIKMFEESKIFSL